AGNFFGFFNADAEDGLESTHYRPENEEGWRSYSGKEPGYYGRPTGNIPELAQRMVGDSRFLDCAVRTVWDGLTQRTFVDEVEPHAVVFADHEMNVKDLVRSIVNSDAYKAAAALDPGVNERFVGRKLVSPEVFSSVIKGITGYTWLFDGRDGLRNNTLGLPV